MSTEKCKAMHFANTHKYACMHMQGLCFTLLQPLRGKKKESTKIPLCVELAKNKNPVNMSDCMKEGRIM